MPTLSLAPSPSSSRFACSVGAKVPIVPSRAFPLRADFSSRVDASSDDATNRCGCRSGHQRHTPARVSNAVAVRALDGELDDDAGFEDVRDEGPIRPRAGVSRGTRRERSREEEDGILGGRRPRRRSRRLAA